MDTLVGQPMEIGTETSQRRIHAGAANTGGTAHWGIEHVDFSHMSPWFGYRRSTISRTLKKSAFLDDGYQRFQPPKPIEINAITYSRAILRTTHEAGLFEYPEMLGNGGLSKRKLINNLAANTRFPSRKYSQDSNASGVADCLGEPRQFLVCFRPFERLQTQLGLRRLRRTAQIALGLLSWHNLIVT